MVCANDVSGPPGKLTYTQMLNRSGRIECDLTVARLAADRFYMVTGTGYRTHDKAWILNNIDSGLDAGLGLSDRRLATTGRRARLRPHREGRSAALRYRDPTLGIAMARPLIPSRHLERSDRRSRSREISPAPPSLTRSQSLQ